jgi:hypothetical protein
LLQALDAVICEAGCFLVVFFQGYTRSQSSLR